MREWVRVARRPGHIDVTVTVMQGGTVARWTERTFLGQIPEAVRFARKQALRCLTDTQEALA